MVRPLLQRSDGSTLVLHQSRAPSGSLALLKPLAPLVLASGGYSARSGSPLRVFDTLAFVLRGHLPRLAMILRRLAVPHPLLRLTWILRKPVPFHAPDGEG